MTLIVQYGVENIITNYRIRLVIANSHKTVLTFK